MSDLSATDAKRDASDTKEAPADAPVAASRLTDLREASVAFVLPYIRDLTSDRQLTVWLLAAVIGALVALAALAFRYLIGIVQLPWLGSTSEQVVTLAANVPWWGILLAPITGGLVVGLILNRWMPGKRAHGVADVIEARAIRDCKIDPRTGLLSALISAITLGSGGSAGREGPVVHLGATIASFAEDHFRLSPGARRTLLACGVAAAVSASFNAPIAGVLFAHEVILAHYAVRAFVPIVIASVTGGIIARLHFGNTAAFIIPEYQITSYWEFPAFALLGVTCAIVAALFHYALTTTERLAWRIEIPLWLRPAVGGAMVGAMGIFLPHVLGVGYEATDAALNRQLPLAMLLVLIVAKAVATSITLATRLAGGIFSPSLYLGAMAGGAFGVMATMAFPQMASSDGLYAILGMGAVAACMLGAPVSTTVIVFELTGGYDMTIALLLTVSVAVGLSSTLIGTTFFHWQLTKRGLFLQEGPHKEIMRKLMVLDFMTELSPDDEPVALDSSRGNNWLTAGDTLERALRAFDRTGDARIPVVSDGDQTRVVGWAYRVDALSVFNSALIEAHVEEHR